MSSRGESSFIFSHPISCTSGPCFYMRNYLYDIILHNSRPSMDANSNVQCPLKITSTQLYFLFCFLLVLLFSFSFEWTNEVDLVIPYSIIYFPRTLFWHFCNNSMTSNTSKSHFSRNTHRSDFLTDC